jgi:hypothetical protein
MVAVMIPETTHQSLREMVGEDEKVTAFFIQAVENLRRERMFDQLDSAFDELRADECAWAEVLSERHAWDGTLADGLVSE